MILALCAGLVWIALAAAGGRNGFPQSHLFLLASFLAGIVSTLPAFAAEHALTALLRPENAATLPIMAGPIEETCKFAAAWFVISRLAPNPSQPGPATAAAVAATIGFTTVENVAYLLEFGLAAIPPRFLVTPLVHLSWSLFWGRTMEPPQRPVHFAVMLAAAAASHALYNMAVTLWPLLGLPWILLATWYIWRHPGRNAGVCRLCAGQPAGITGICPGCGATTPPPLCPQCGLSQPTHSPGPYPCRNGTAIP